MTNKIVPVVQNTELNPKIWEPSGQLQPRVRAALLKIADHFIDFLNFEISVKDLQITGSQANYNYTDFSDLDLHIIVDYKEITCDQPVEDLFDTKRKLYSKRHDITIRGIPVELYVEDLDRPAVSSAYSLVSNTWVKQPKPVEKTWDLTEIERDTLAWLRRIKNAVHSENLNKIQRLTDQLKQYRQQSLDKDGEFGLGNLVYKNLRNLDALEILMTARLKLTDQDLSLKELDSRQPRP